MTRDNIVFTGFGFLLGLVIVIVSYAVLLTANRRRTS